MAPYPRHRFGLVSLFNDISLFMGYLMPKPSLWYYLTHSSGDKEVHAFFKGISPNVNEIV